MKFLAPVLLAILGIVGGVVIGAVMKPATETPDAGADGDAPESAEFSDKDPIESASDSEYTPLEKKILAPFTRKDGRSAFVAVEITLEMAPGRGEWARGHEPKLAAAFLVVVTAFAAGGAFDDHQHAPHTLKELNAELLKAARKVLGAPVRKVLIANLLTSDA